MVKPTAGYVLSDTTDPEERLEDACAYRALCDHWILDVDTPYKHNQVFGSFSDVEQLHRGFRVFGNHKQCEYLEDPSFVIGSKREFIVADLNEAINFHKNYDYKSFVKLPQCKFTQRVDGCFISSLGDMGYFLANGEKCLIQEFVNIGDEYRFFIIDGEIVTWGKCDPKLTPIHHIYRDDPPSGLMDFAYKMAGLCDKISTTIDIGMSERGWIVIELNPFDFGRCGLYDSDVLKLSESISKLCIKRPAPESNKSDMDNLQRVEFSWR